MENEIKSKDDSTSKIILFIIGALFGAVVTSGAFLISVNTIGANSSSSDSSQNQMQGGPQMQGSDNQGQPPAMPGEDNSDNSSNTQSNN